MSTIKLFGTEMRYTNYITKWLIFVFILTTSFCFAHIPFNLEIEQEQFCLPVYEYGVDGEMITRVIFNTIDQTSPFISGTTPEYEDFTSVSTDIEQGSIHQISVKGPSNVFPSDVMVYIDFNQNGDFSDDGEGFYIGMLQPANPANAFTITSDIIIPSDALTGTTIMRIVKNSNVAALSNPQAPNSINDPCADNLRAGQVEEYSVNIIGTQIGYCVPDFVYPSSQAGVKLDLISLVGETVAWDTNPIVYDGDGYADYTNEPFVDLISGNTYDLDFHTDWQDPHFINVRAWIDYNQDYEFDQDEEIGYISSGIAPSGEGTFNFTVPENTPVGIYRLRVVMQFPNSDPNSLTPCGTINSYGVAIDYNIEVIEGIVTEEYCDVTVEWDVEPITLVDFADLNNPTSAIINGTPAYEDFTSMIANIEQGETYTITVKGNTAGSFEHDIRVFIDWNQDIEFDMTTEFYTVSLLPSNGEDSVEATTNITVPADAVLGETRMRVIKDMWNIYEEGELDACTDAYYGQIEDYTINISVASAIVVESITVITQNNLPAEITTENGTLQLVATVNPSDANQEVIWSIESGDDSASVDTNGLATAIANGIATVRATSVEDETVYGEIEITIGVLSTGNFTLTNISVYPNPTTGIVNIQANEEVSEFKAFNIAGQLILQGNSNTLNLDKFNSGIYLIQVTLKDNSVHTHKLIKN